VQQTPPSYVATSSQARRLRRASTVWRDSPAEVVDVSLVACTLTNKC